MKQFLVITLACCFLLSGCSSQSSETNRASTSNINDISKTSDSATKYPEITIKDPIVMANTYITSQDYYLQIVLKEGSYRYEYLTGQQSFWNGSYYLQVFQDTPELGNLIAEIQLEIGHEKELSFSGQFELFLDDYNNDGQSDFTLGQWIGSNQSIYQIYSIDKNGIPYILPISISGSDQNSMIIASHSYSVALEKLSKDSITYENYDQTTGNYYSTELKWDETKFVSE